MNRKVKRLFGLGLLLFSMPLAAQQLPYQNPSLSPEERAADLLSRLTLEEKAALMQNTSPAIPRLGIKAYDWWSEALHGVARAGLATVYPQAIGMGASFDDRLLHEVFTAVSDEARAKSTEFSKNGGLKRYQGLTFWTPNVNIFRDPRWGRGQETYGEDPYLTGQMGMAVVRGLQGPEDSKYDKLHACAKHFAVHSGPEWNRHEFNAENIAPRDLWETYLPAFKDLVQKAHVKEVMCAYNRFEGEACCGSNRLLMQILRDEWGYKELVVSDCWAINDLWMKGHHETHPTKQHAVAGAVLSGTDVECGSDYASLPEAVEAGLINESQIDISVKRLLKARFELGEMDNPSLVSWTKIPYSVVDCAVHRQLALQMARESIVLLQNKNNILPLDTDGKIALVGPNANDSVMQWGNYNGYPSHTVTLLEALKERIPADKFIYEPGCDRTSTLSLESVFSRCKADGQTGFKATYWNNTDMSGTPAAVTQVTTPFRFITTGGTTFASGVNIQDFSAVYEAVFTPEKSEDIGFCFQSHGMVRLSIDGKEVAKSMFMKNNDKIYTLKAEKGKQYNLKIEFVFASKDRAASLEFDMGRDVPVDPEAENCEAIVQAWYPGQAGGTAVAEVLTGEYNPAGKLPITFYKNLKQLPDFLDYSMKGRTYRYMTETPLFCFGHGLSYTTFGYGDATLSTPTLKDGQTVTLTVPVSNTGARDGEEVVQVYIRRPADKEGPSHTLRAFKRVYIRKGETKQVELTLTPESFEWFDTATNTMRPVKGSYEILYGGTSDMKMLKRTGITIE